MEIFMTLAQLRYFSVDDLVILKYLTDMPSLTVTLIAEKMHLSQPAVSQRIRKMEEVLGEKLIERSGRGVKLTSFGVSHACRASAALTILDSV
jgi:DNA-binding transcriptional LysR family regulator